jgi:hypothetical protein
VIFWLRDYAHACGNESFEYFKGIAVANKHVICGFKHNETVHGADC